MCGRYYVDQETARELEKMFCRMKRWARPQHLARFEKIGAGDVCPTDTAPVLSGKNGSVCCTWQRWGFPGFQGNRVIFNARCESVMEKSFFRDSMYNSRMAVPAAWFYEWNSRKEKNTFFRADSPVLFMAGLWRRYGDTVRFVILTTGANHSMKPVHDRMPLILDQEDIARWILDDDKAGELLRKTPCLLERKTDYEQLSLF